MRTLKIILNRLIFIYLIIVTLALLSGCSPANIPVSEIKQDSQNQKNPVSLDSFKQILKTQECENEIIQTSKWIGDFSGDKISDGLAFFSCPSSAGRSRQFGYFAIGNLNTPDIYEVPFNMAKLSFSSMKFIGPNKVRFVFDSWSEFAPACCSDQKETYEVSFASGWPVVISHIIS